MKKYDLIVWDWNGTLLNDRLVCTEVINGMLERRGLHPISSERYREVFTFPVRDYYEKIGLDFSKESFESLAGEYVPAYYEASKACSLFQGAEETLKKIYSLEIPQVIVSASGREALLRQVARYPIEGYFTDILGMENDLGKGKEGLALSFLNAHGISPEGTLFVGDTLHDAEVARDLGACCVLISDGHQSEERLSAAGVPVLQGITEIPAFLSR